MNVNRVTFKEFPGGIVKATIHDCAWDALDKINNNFIAPATAGIHVSFNWSSKAAGKYLMNPTYSAIARCSKEDTYSFEVGKKIAERKLAKKYNSALDSRVALFLTHMNKVCEGLDKYFENRMF